MQPSCVSIMLLKSSQAVSSSVRFSLGYSEGRREWRVDLRPIFPVKFISAHITEGSARSERLVVIRFSIVGIATTKLRLSIDMRFLAMNGKRVICSMCNTELDWDCIALLDDIDSCDEAEFRMQIRQLALTSLELLNAAIFDKECEPLFSLEIYGHVIGMFKLNNLLDNTASLGVCGNAREEAKQV
ncbi:hypothetical protein LguiA_006164 [Lonicera macranthoides]